MTVSAAKFKNNAAMAWIHSTSHGGGAFLHTHTTHKRNSMSTPSVKRTNIQWLPKVGPIIPKLEAAMQRGATNFEHYETRYIERNDDVQYVPQEAGYYLINVDPVKTTPSSTPVMNYRDWEALPSRPGWLWRVLYCKTKLIKGREISFGVNQAWTAAIVIDQRQPESHESDSGEDSSMQVEEAAIPDFDDPEFIEELAAFSPYAAATPKMIDIHPAGGPPMDRTLLMAYYSQEIGKSADGSNAYCLQNAAKWTQAFPEAVMGGKMDMDQLNVIHIAVIKELVQELIHVKQDLANLRQSLGK